MSTQGRKHRVLVGFITPPIVAVLFLYLILLLVSKSELDVQFSNTVLLIGLPLSFLVAGLQSMIFALLMEYVINENIRKKWVSVCLAAVLGGVSCAFFGWLFVVLGMLVGTILGWYLSCHHDKTVKKCLTDRRAC